ncbi:signal transduction histidine kinase [Pedobacter cryoconitis]|uniref:histidine kinase n=1 Tax=Pedobacter cryoconitis TaxID=188932 RepID=A0A7W8ZLR6_9SPHI|nr:HAMP domain-containing sensor histidine kinase [Pedobacter cryoconitis]MBB5636215.1 signal transduction histidine kinase [Pedobacter cryoconitis]MBB6272867.1 signal transduction histidine kinase [Pedobacter cryoconitis]
MNLNTRITFLFAILSAVIISLLSGFVWYFANEFAFEDFYKRLEARVNIASQIKLATGANTVEYREARQKYLERLPQEEEQVFLADKASKIAFDKRVHLPSSFYKTIESGQMARYRNENVFYAGKYLKQGPNGYIVIISAKDPYGYRELKDLQKILFAGFFLSVALSYFVGRKFSDFTFKPIRELIKKAKGISAENLHQRLPLIKGSDEIAEITQTFNDMLDRLQTAFETQNNFISNASHELRTPLTIISGEAELAVFRAGHLDPEFQKSLATIQAEAERLENILTSLLSLAQSGFDGEKQRWEDIRLDELIWDVKESIDLVNPENQIRIDLSKLPDNPESINLHGNLNLIKLAVTNIVNNACKYSDNRVVDLGLSVTRTNIVISVKDQGIGIPEDELQHVFEPFFRASNTTRYNGYGVGLPLSLNIIRLHKGSIAIKTVQESGTEMSILLPRAL